MKKVDCIFYLVDNYLYLYNINNSNLKIYKFENYIFEGRIIKPNILIKRINEILKKEKLVKVFTGQKTIIVYEPQLKYIDKKIIIDTFDQCGFKDIKLVNSINLLPKSKYYIQINDNYLIEYYNNKYKFIKYNKYFSLKTLIKIIAKNTNLEIILLGVNNKINEISEFDNKLLYLENSNTYFIDKLLKEKLP